MVVELARVTVLILGGFTLGLSFAVFWLYVRLHRSTQPSPLPRYFVPSIAFSHSLLVAAICGEIVQHVIQHRPFEWWLSPLIAVAFTLSIYALVQMMRSPYLRSLERSLAK